MHDVASLIEALSRPEAYPHPVDTIEVHQTHISVVFLAGPFAYKVKKPVNLGFVDFSTLEKRKHFCEEEARLNRRLAPQVYLGVVPIVRALDDGVTRFGGTGELIDWAVQMLRLPADATLESRIARGEISAREIGALGQRLAAFHRDAERSGPIASYGRFAVVAENARENLAQAAALVNITVESSVFERVRALTETQLEEHRVLIEARASQGKTCDTHGDLHLDHVYLFPDRPPPDDLVPIDCIEFSERFRFADPVADMAFAAMDLTFHGRRDLARVFADAYFEASGDAEGRRLLAFYCAYRAVIRAKVEGIELNEKELDREQHEEAAARARGHWLLALGELEAPSKRPALLLIAGLPGSGKSTLAKALGELAHFEVLRSDIVRKQFSGGQRAELYSEKQTERTYYDLQTLAIASLRRGGRVLIDANFRKDSSRREFIELARRWCVPVFFIQCNAAPAIIKERLSRRKHDASDADWKVYQMLESTWEQLSTEVQRVALPVETSGDPPQSQQIVLDALTREGLL